MKITNKIKIYWLKIKLWRIRRIKRKIVKLSLRFPLIISKEYVILSELLSLAIPKILKTMEKIKK